MVMGNASGREQGEGSSSGGNNFQENYEHMAHPPPLNPLNPGETFTRPGEAIQVQPHAVAQTIEYNNNVQDQNFTRMKISWTHGGRQVVITGSWNNSETREPLQNVGNEFVVIKFLPPGLYQYRFIVDGCWRCAPDLPWVYDDSGTAFNVLDLQNVGNEFVVIKFLPPGLYQYRFIVDGCWRCAPDLPWVYDDSGTAFNVLDLQEYGLQMPEQLSKFEAPPSPPSSYDNRNLSENDFSKPPPEVPPQLQVPFLNRPPPSSNEGGQPLPMPHYSQLNHLYIQNQIGGEYFALSSTYRFRQKFVTMVLFKPLNRENP